MEDVEGRLTLLRRAIDATPGSMERMLSACEYQVPVAVLCATPTATLVDVAFLDGPTSFLFTWWPRKGYARVRMDCGPAAWVTVNTEGVEALRGMRWERPGISPLELGFHTKDRHRVAGHDVTRHMVDAAIRVVLDGRVPSSSEARSASRAFARLMTRDAERAVLATLSPEAADLCRSLRRSGPFDILAACAVPWCAGAGDPTWVRQAVERYPALSALLQPSSFDGDRTAAIRRLSNGAPAFDVALDTLRSTHPSHRSGAVLEGAALRSACRLHPDILNLDGGAVSNFGLLTHILAAFHADKPRRPALDDDELAAAAAFAMTLTRAMDNRAWDGGWLMALGTDPFPNAWLAGAAGRGAVAGATDRSGRLVGGSDGLRDVLSSLERSIRILLAHTPGRDGKAHDTWFPKTLLGAVAFREGRTAETWRRLDADWHGRVRDLSDREAIVLGTDPARPRNFAHVTYVTRVVDGVAIAPLLDADAYRREGRAMDHCIGSYAPRAERAHVASFSLEGPPGNRSSASFDLRPVVRPILLGDPEGPSLSPGDHKGPGNKPPPPAHVHALARLMAEVGSSPGWLDDMAARHQAGMPVGERAFDDKLPQEARQALLAIHFDNVAPFLTSRERAMGPDGWVAHSLAAHGPAHEATMADAYRRRDQCRLPPPERSLIGSARITLELVRSLYALAGGNRIGPGTASGF